MGQTLLEVVTRRGVAANLPDGIDIRLAGTPGAGIYVTPDAAPLAEIVRQGEVWYAKGTVTTATLNQVAPTTGAASSLWNGEAAGGKSLILLAVGLWSDVSGGAANIITPYILPSIVQSAAAPATAEADIIRGFRLGDTYTGLATVSQTVTVTDNGWLALGTWDTAALTANKGMGYFIPLPVPFIIPPLYYVGLHAVGTAATAEFGFYYVFQERQIDIP